MLAPLVKERGQPFSEGPLGCVLIFGFGASGSGCWAEAAWKVEESTKGRLQATVCMASLRIRMVKPRPPGIDWERFFRPRVSRGTACSDRYAEEITGRSLASNSGIHTCNFLLRLTLLTEVRVPTPYGRERDSAPVD